MAFRITRALEIVSWLTQIASYLGLPIAVVGGAIAGFFAWTAFLKERINLKALKLLESCSRLACHCDALVFLFYGSPVTPLPERSHVTSVLCSRGRLAN
jgi:hypothetical protein